VQGWWSVTGIAVEIGGFAILATDVAREYGRHRTVERFRAGAAAAKREVAAKSNPNAPSRKVKDTLSDGARLGTSESIEDLRARIQMQYRAVDCADAMMAWSESLSKDDRKKYDFYSHNFEEIATALPIKADRIAIQPYRRAPIRFGILLVLIGAGLQMVGSWPCA